MKPLFLAACACVAAAAPVLAADPSVPYPENYRSWHHVKSMVIEEDTPFTPLSAGSTTCTQTRRRSRATATAAFPTARSSCSTCSKPAARTGR